MPPDISPAGPLSARLVILDEEPLNIAALEEFLRRAGYANVHGMSLAECSAERLREIRPHLLLLAIDPLSDDPDGLLDRLQADPLLRKVPVIVLSAQEDHAFRLRALGLGVTDFLIKPLDPEELVLRLRNALSAEAERERMAHSDAVTGLPNHESLLVQLHWSIKHARRYQRVGAVLQMGLDRFKEVNEAHGPTQSDRLLLEIGQRLQDGLRDSDLVVRVPGEADIEAGSGAATEAVFIARARGDEFSVLLPVIDRADLAAVVAQRIVDLMAEPFRIDGLDLFITCRLGIAVFPDDSSEPETLMQQASTAMGHVNQKRAAGVSGMQFYSSELNARSLKRMNIERELRRALDRGELRVFYQPKVELPSGRLCSAEALVRWQHPERGLLGPAEFIGPAEAAGLIGALGHWVLREALYTLAGWDRKGLHLSSVAVNVSSLQLEGIDLSIQVRDALAEAQVEGSRLCLELTESAIIDQGPHVTRTLVDIKAQGVRLSLDDFGTGYSSLTYLRKFPLDEIKIDRSFVLDCDTDHNSSAITATIIAMAHRLGLKVVAEGIETAAQLRFISAEGCDQFQGFLCGPALPAEKFEALMVRAQTEPFSPDAVEPWFVGDPHKLG
jgi:predicted signal transduction protein with EAL and GGDEF domain